METAYSVLTSVYKEEQPENLRRSICSMLEQTLPPSQFILVCDGPLNSDLNSIIERFQVQYPVLEVFTFREHRGLGQALNVGLAHCRSDIVFRMDSDDIAYPNRCEKQLAYMQEYGLDLCSATVEEFVGDLRITGRRKLPAEHDALLRFAHKRNPMNHPCVAFRKSIVEKAGSYRHMPYFEDYDLWARMILSGAKLGNIPEPLLYMRAGEAMFRRRSGFKYCRHTIRFWREMRRIGFCGMLRAWTNILVRCTVSLLPLKGVQYLYRKKLRIISTETTEVIERKKA